MPLNRNEAVTDDQLQSVVASLVSIATGDDARIATGDRIRAAEVVIGHAFTYDPDETVSPAQEAE